MSTHVKVLGALFLGLGWLGVIAAVVLSVAFRLLAGAVGASDDAGAPIGEAALGFTGVALTIGLVAVSAPAIACGWGLLKCRAWARMLGIVLAAVALVGFPFGTVFGVYALWVLCSTQTEAVFGS